MAHWDHLGVGFPNDKGDKIYNGALDNATGVAGVMAIAKAFKALPAPPRRSVLFLGSDRRREGLDRVEALRGEPYLPAR